MATCRHWSVSSSGDSDDVPQCRILSSDKAEWWLISAALCRWSRCFLADQLWFMTRIREEEELKNFHHIILLTYYSNLWFIKQQQDLLQMIMLFISELDRQCSWLQTTAEHDVVWSMWAGDHGELSCAHLQRMAVSCKISRADRWLFGLSSWLSMRSSTAMRRTQSIAAWLLDNCTRLVDSLQQIVNASKFPTTVGKFTQQPSCTIPL